MCTGQALSVNVYNPPLSSVLLGVTLIRLNGIRHGRVWSASIIKTALDWLATSRAAPGPRLSLLLSASPPSSPPRSTATSFSCVKLRRERQLWDSSAGLTRLNAVTGRYFRYREAGFAHAYVNMRECARVESSSWALRVHELFIFISFSLRGVFIWKYSQRIQDVNKDIDLETDYFARKSLRLWGDSCWTHSNKLLN